MRRLSANLALALILATHAFAQDQEARLKYQWNVSGPYTVATFAQALADQGLSFTVSPEAMEDKRTVFLSLTDGGFTTIQVMESFAKLLGYLWEKDGPLLRLSPSIGGVAKAAMAPQPTTAIDLAQSISSQASPNTRWMIPSRTGPPLNLTPAQRHEFYTRSVVRYSTLNAAQRRLVPRGRGSFVYWSGGVPVTIDRSH